MTLGNLLKKITTKIDSNLGEAISNQGWNQLVETVHVQTTISATTSYYGFTTKSNYVNGHKYYFSAKNLQSSIKFQSEGYVGFCVLMGNGGYASTIGTCNSNISSSYRPYLYNTSTASSVTVDCYLNIIDLTALFGSGNEPSTVAEFRKIFTEDYYPYKNGWADLIVDYVVEQGTSGIWTYRKWNSGIAECWGATDITFNTSLAFDSIYRDAQQLSFPTGLFTSVKTVNATCGTWTDAWGSVRTVTASSLYIIDYDRYSGSQTRYYHIEAKGTWK